VNVLRRCSFSGYLLLCALLWWRSSAPLVTVSALELGNWLAALNSQWKWHWWFPSPPHTEWPELHSATAEWLVLTSAPARMGTRLSLHKVWG